MARLSKQQQAEIRLKIINTAVELFTENGFETTSMKQIARAAGIGDATIYKYFANKDKLIYGYYGLIATKTTEQFLAEDDLSEYSLQEKFQLLIDIYLNNFLPNREFVCDSINMIMQSPSILFKDVAPVREEFVDLIANLLNDAEQAGEIAQSPFTDATAKLANDYLLAVLLYWVNDDSEEFSNTTQMVDMSLELGVEILRSGIVSKATDLVSFFVKAHLFRFMGSGFLNKLIMKKSFGL
ncbi:TetR/AcrR family transcriptional regulator [Colwellia sp. TT2012]|uniref:TetR/AcrR family transcriptional regulator n=1 Tax=Colwellia sp. TT2012 TaxID=1720342 RepID=UPI00070C15A1|nr:TetR family transcriptional regulator [Colwellia sp. TT2012]